MAIAGIILAAPAEVVDGVEAALGQRLGVVEVRRTPADAEIAGLAVVLERPAEGLQEELQALGRLPGVRELHLTFANYEDDMDAQGHIRCAPCGVPLRDARREGAS